MLRHTDFRNLTEPIVKILRESNPVKMTSTFGVTTDFCEMDQNFYLGAHWDKEKSFLELSQCG